MGGLGVGFGISTGPLIYQSWIDYRHSSQQRANEAAEVAAQEAESAERQARIEATKASQLKEKEKYLTRYADVGEWTWLYGANTPLAVDDYQLSSTSSSENCTNRIRDRYGTQTLSICKGAERNYWRMEKVWAADCEVGKSYPTNVRALECELRGTDKTKVLSVTIHPDYRVESGFSVEKIRPPQFGGTDFGGYSWRPDFDDFPYGRLVQQATLMGIKALPKAED